MGRDGEELAKLSLSRCYDCTVGGQHDENYTRRIGKFGSIF